MKVTVLLFVWLVIASSSEAFRTGWVSGVFVLVTGLAFYLQGRADGDWRGRRG